LAGLGHAAAAALADEGLHVEEDCPCEARKEVLAGHYVEGSGQNVVVIVPVVLGRGRDDVGDELAFLGNNDHGSAVEYGLDVFPEHDFVAVVIRDAGAGGCVTAGVGGHGVHGVLVLVVGWDDAGVAEGGGGGI